jgi:hypothetical protein
VQGFRSPRGSVQCKVQCRVQQVQPRVQQFSAEVQGVQALVQCGATRAGGLETPAACTPRLHRPRQP